MRYALKRSVLAGLTGLSILVSVPGPAGSQSPNTRTPTLYVVGYAHLDTEWRWDYPTTIREYLPKTMRINFSLFEKYPHYVFNFSGANRYRMMKEYYPEAYGPPGSRSTGPPRGSWPTTCTTAPTGSGGGPIPGAGLMTPGP